MQKLRVIFALFVLFAGLPSVAAAQGFPFKWWQDDKFKTQLVLTADQCARLEKTYQEFRPKMADQLARLEGMQNRLSDVIGVGVMPEAEVIRMIDQVETARAELGKTRTLMTYRLRQALTPDQRTKMKALHDEWEKQRRQQGPVRKRPERSMREGGTL